MTPLAMTGLASLVFSGLVKLTLGGAAAAVTGRAVATSWQPYWHVVFYVALLAGVTRFLSYALAHQELLSLWSYLGEALVLLVIATLGFWIARRKQMATQYYWLFRTGQGLPPGAGM